MPFFRRNKKHAHDSDDDEPMTGKGFSSGRSVENSRPAVGPLHTQQSHKGMHQSQKHLYDQQSDNRKKRGLFSRSRSAPRSEYEDVQARHNRSASDDDHTDGTTDQERSQPSVPGQLHSGQMPNKAQRQQQQQRSRTASQSSAQNSQDESSEDRTPPIKNGEDDSDCSSYPSVGMNVVQGQRGPPPKSNSRGRDAEPRPPGAAATERGAANPRLSRKGSASNLKKSADASGNRKQAPPNLNLKTVQPDGSQRPSLQKKVAPKHRRNNSSSNATTHTTVTHTTMKTSQSDKTHATFKSQQSTENAAMQQLAMLVVNLRGDLAELKKEKEGVEEQLERMKRRAPPPQSTAAAGKGIGSNEDENSLLEEYKQENLELKADIDAFLLENDALTKEISELKLDKEAAEDLINRLKAESHNASSLSVDRKSSTGMKGGTTTPEQEIWGSKVTALEERLKEVMDENHKLEGELRLMVDEKQDMMRQHSNSVSDVALKEKEVERLNAALKESKEQLEQLEEDAVGNGGEVEKLKLALKEAESRLERQLEGEKTFLLLVDQHEEKMREAQAKNEEQMKLVERLREDIADITIVKEELKAELRDGNAYISELESELEQKNGMSKSDLERYATEVGEYESRLEEMREKLEKTQAEKSDCQSELKALREILTSIEQQKREYQKKNNEIGVTNDDLNRKVNDMIIQRNRTQTEIDKIKEENASMADELERIKLSEKASTSAAVAPASSACSADTVLMLQKMIANLETSKDGLATDLAKKDALLKSEAEKVAQLEQNLRVQKEMTNAEGKSDSELKRKLSGVLSENEEMKPRLSHLENEKKLLDEQMANLKCELADKQERIDTLENSMKQLQSDVDAKSEKIWYHEETISSLQQTKKRLEADLSEASDAIALLEDELEQKESEVNSAKTQTVILRQKISQLEKQKEALSKSNEELEGQIHDLHTQIKVIQMEKHVSSEEMDSLREAKEKAEDELHEVVQSSGAQISKLQEELDESSDAIALLKEELGIVEHDMADKDEAIHSLETELAEKAANLKDAEREQSRLQQEHQAGVETIATLKKLIQTNDQRKTDLELELSAMTKNANELGEELKKSTSQIRELEKKVSEFDDNNRALTNANEEIKKQMHELLLETTSTALVTRSASVGTNLKSMSSERAKTCDALISDLRQQVQDLLSERDAALEEVEVLKSGADALCRRPDENEVLTESHEDDHDDDDMTHHTSALETKPCEEDEASIPMTIEPTRRKKSAGASLSSSQPSREGSSLLEQAKSIVHELEVKRSKTPDAKRGNAEAEDEKPVTRRLSIKTIENDIKGKELESTRENVPDGAKPISSDKKFDIDQLTAIYFDRCGMSASKLSDMSSDASSSVYRRAKQQKDKNGSKAKKVKICRNGVFMGTYEGDLNSKGQRHGFGVLICDNGNSYEGEWKNDKRDGLGIARYSSGDVYDGEWKRGKRQGHGVMYIEAGDTYIGNWEKGLKHGAGTYHWADGEVDVSWYEEDRRVGQGVRWNATRNKAFQLMRGTRQKEIALDEAYKTAEKLGLNLAKAESGSA